MMRRKIENKVENEKGETAAVECILGKGRGSLARPCSRVNLVQYWSLELTGDLHFL